MKVLIIISIVVLVISGCQSLTRPTDSAMILSEKCNTTMSIEKVCKYEGE